MTETQLRITATIVGGVGLLAITQLWNDLSDATERSARNEAAIERIRTRLSSNAENDEQIRQRVLEWIMKEEQIRHHRDTLHCMAINQSLPVEQWLDCGKGAGGIDHGR